jgi:hypothetical protein
MAQCDDGASGPFDITKSRNETDLMLHVANELRAAAETEWAAGQRPTVDFPYRDFDTLADQVREDALVMGLRTTRTTRSGRKAAAAARCRRTPSTTCPAYS